MKFSTIILIGFIFFAFGLSINSCKKNGSCKQKNISSSSKDSHNSGQSCTQCHTSGGQGEGCFNVAGSAFTNTATALTGGTVDLYTGPNGTGNVKYSIIIDKSGNFYSTASMDINDLYPVVTGPNGTKKYMSTPISSGSCNSCHGNSTNKIWSN
ncbi:MAG: hypothetical protein HYR91_10535 [Flavobacteriia bacterium]|nr:hypothetical protein [Flavobacteriia bacterium]